MKTIIANWKMTVGSRESVALARGTLLLLRGRKVTPEVVICPSFTALSEVHKVVARSSVWLGAQDVCWEEQGAYTGEVSPRMLTELGVSHVLIGHSERRGRLGETDEMIHQKLVNALEHGLTPILCIGETQQEREAGIQQERVREQLVAAFSGVRLKSNARVFVAYEPVWAIGSGHTPEVPEVVAMHTFIRTVLTEALLGSARTAVRVLYGGSVDGENAYRFLREDEVNGVLVGGASVKLNQLKEIMTSASEVLEAKEGIV
ncbi:triose-phosphate isomerase [Candidatus Parcubacteria bacterium]|nr:triose-phosphate isomerase [Candidatus Parcubacteria bacterium]